MLNIIIKNRTLIKIIKYLKIIFKFLNKHLYILSILAFFRRNKDSYYFIIIKFIIKLVILINLAISSGLFFSVLDLHTPFDVIISFYQDVIKPYFDSLLEKFYKLIDIQSKPKTTSKLIYADLDTETPSLKAKNNSSSLSLRDYISFFAFIFILYFIFGVPGPSIEPQLFNEYNFLNRSLISVKKLIVNIIDSLFGGNGTTGGSADSGNNSTSSNIHGGNETVELDNLGDKTPKPSSNKGKAKLVEPEVNRSFLHQSIANILTQPR